MRVSGIPGNKKVPKNISSHVNSFYFSLSGFLSVTDEIDLEIQISFSRPRSFSTQMLLYNNVCQFTFDMSCAQYRMYLIQIAINNNNMQNTQFHVSWFRISYIFEMLAHSLLDCRGIEGQKTYVRLVNAISHDRLKPSDGSWDKKGNMAGIDIDPALVILHWLIEIRRENIGHVCSKRNSRR